MFLRAPRSLLSPSGVWLFFLRNKKPHTDVWHHQFGWTFYFFWFSSFFSSWCWEKSSCWCIGDLICCSKPLGKIRRIFRGFFSAKKYVCVCVCGCGCVCVLGCVGGCWGGGVGWEIWRISFRACTCGENCFLFLTAGFINLFIEKSACLMPHIT